MKTNEQVLKEVLGSNFARGSFSKNFYKQPLSVKELSVVFEHVAASNALVGGQNIEGVLRVGPVTDEKPFAVMAQLHGNEPAGLAVFLLVMALDKAKLLKHPVYCVIGNLNAARQYFKAYAAAPNAAQETRDNCRAAKGEGDMNRVPADFLGLDKTDPYVKRIHQLYGLCDHISGLLDVHSARGNLTCVTECSDEKLLENSPIKNMLLKLLDSISSHSSTVPFKKVVAEKKNIKHLIGIEAGTHEAENSFKTACEFALSLFYNLKITTLKPMENAGELVWYEVGKALSFRTLEGVGEMREDDMLYPTHQFEELEFIAKGQVVMVAKPSGVQLKSPMDFHCLFVTKPAAKYSDKSVSPWPISIERLDEKFAYPAIVIKAGSA